MHSYTPLYKRMLVTNAQDARRLGKNQKAKIGAVITFEHDVFNPGKREPWHGPRLRDGRPQLVLTHRDIEQEHISRFIPEDAHLLPQPEHIHKILKFGREFFQRNKKDILLIHCYGGVSRSTAALLGILADAYGPGGEMLALSHLLLIRPQAAPNTLMVKHIDDILGRRGALLGVVMRHRRLIARRAGYTAQREEQIDEFYRTHPEKRPSDLAAG